MGIGLSVGKIKLMILIEFRKVFVRNVSYTYIIKRKGDTFDGLYIANMWTFQKL